MEHTVTAIAYLDGTRLRRALAAGIRHLIQRKEYINKINVFPVPDGDTGTNMAFTLKAVYERLRRPGDDTVAEVMSNISDAALDGARGNSGAIMAQYFQGFYDAIADHPKLSADSFANAAKSGATAAWGAMSKPVEGTLPTVLRDFADELLKKATEGVQDIQQLLKLGLERARVSLANTPNQLAVLKQAGVVDAGGQGFVDLLEGIWAFIDQGDISFEHDEPHVSEEEDILHEAHLDIGEHRYCTECVIVGNNLDRVAVMHALEDLDASSLVVAGSQQRIRVHIHVNTPADVFLTCESFGEISQQKADDMQRQHSLLNQSGNVAIVMDSGADLPVSEIDRLGIHVVPVRVIFGDRDYLDRVSITADEFYRKLDESEQTPQTSQPPASDFSRQYTLLTSHGYKVINVGLSSALSGTTSAARFAAEKVGDDNIHIFDTLNASTGQGLLAMAAAEAAAEGQSVEEIQDLLETLLPQTKTFALANDLSYGVRGGRVPPILKKLVDLLHINPVLTNTKEGKLKPGGVIFGRGVHASAFAKRILKHMQANRVYRVVVAHAKNPTAAQELRRLILEQHSLIHSCHVTDAGPALGVHLGPGGLVVGIMPTVEHQTDQPQSGM